MNMRNVTCHILAASAVGLLTVSTAFAAVCTHTDNFPATGPAQNGKIMTGVQSDGSNCGTNRAEVGSGRAANGSKSVGTTLFKGSSSRAFGLDVNNNPVLTCVARDATANNGSGDAEIGAGCNAAARWRANLFFNTL